MNSKATNILLFLATIIVPIVFLFHMLINKLFFEGMISEVGAFFYVDRVFGLIPYVVCIVLGAIVLTSRKETINKILTLCRCVLYGQIIILSIVILIKNINSHRASYIIVPIVYAVICLLLIVLELIRIVSLVKSYSQYDASIGNVDLKGSTAYKIILICVIVYFIILMLTVFITFVPGALTSIIMCGVMALVVGGILWVSKSSSFTKGAFTGNMLASDVEYENMRREKEMRQMRREEEKRRRREEEEKHEVIVGRGRAYIPRCDFKGREIKLWKTLDYFDNTIIIWDSNYRSGEICSLKRLEDGSYHIYEKESGKEIKSSQIPWEEKWIDKLPFIPD